MAGRADEVETAAAAHRFHGPVLALSCFHGSTSSASIAFAMGNEVLLTRRGATGGAGCDQLLSRRLTSLPSGAVVTSLAHSDEWLIAGAGDRLFAQPISPWEGGPPSPLELPVFSYGRIMCVRASGASTFLAVTSRNALIVVRTAHWRGAGVGDLAERVTAGTHVMVGPPMALVLAADALELSPEYIAVFASAYGGRVMVWSTEVGTHSHRALQNTRSQQHSELHAHPSRCAATFAVRALAHERDGGGPGAWAFAVATCSDDRSAAVFTAESLDGPWRCVFRASGPAFSTARVFDVALASRVVCTRSDSCDAAALYLAASTEDGAVFAFCVQPHGIAEGGEPQRVLAAHRLHGGRGASRVGLWACGADLYAVSGGFDGAVVVSTVASEDLASGPVTVDTAEGASNHGAGARTVRCVCASAHACAAFFCLETELFTFPAQPDRAGTARPVRLASWAASTHAAGGGRKVLLPSAMTIAGSDLVLIGTEGGYLMLASARPRRMSMDVASSSPDSPAPMPLGVVTVWVEHRKCMSMRARVWGASETTVEGTSAVVWILSSHAGGATLVTRVDVAAAVGATTPVARVVARLRDCSGLRVTSLELYTVLDKDELLAVVGDQRGTVSVFAISVGAESSRATRAEADVAAQWSQRVFPTPVHTAHLMGATAPRGRVLASTDDGVFAVVDRQHHSASSSPSSSSSPTPLSDEVQGGPGGGELSPLPPVGLRFPMVATEVLAARGGAWVVRHGTTVAVYATAPASAVWTRVSELSGVRAPRLVHASVSDSGDGVCIVHCSDGRRVQGLHVTSPWAATRASVEVAHTGCGSGKDFNASLALAEVGVFVHGNEDSSITVDPVGGGDGVDMRACAEGSADLIPWPRATLHGGHQSNVLALCALPPPAGKGPDKSGPRLRFVTVGGGATVVLWEATPQAPLHVADAVCFTGPGGQRAPTHQSHGRTGGGAGYEKVPRFLSIAAPCAHVVIIGSSDATLRVLVVREAHPGAGRALGSAAPARLCPLSICPPCAPAMETGGACTFVINEEEERPIMSLCVLRPSDAADGRGIVEVAAGDTGGRLYLLRVDVSRAMDGIASVRVCHQLQLEQACVNALTPCSRRLNQHQQMFAAMSDSSNVHLIIYTHGVEDGEGHPPQGSGLATHGRATLTVVSSVSTGVTAGRGVQWLPTSREDSVCRLACVNDERVTLLQAGQSPARKLPTLSVETTVRVTTRCVSGLAVAPIPASRSRQSATVLAVVGQGVEYITCPDLQDEVEGL